MLGRVSEAGSGMLGRVFAAFGGSSGALISKGHLTRPNTDTFGEAFWLLECPKCNKNFFFFK
jgi:hypothetical protein